MNGPVRRETSVSLWQTFPAAEPRDLIGKTAVRRKEQGSE